MWVQYGLPGWSVVEMVYTGNSFFDNLVLFEILRVFKKTFIWSVYSVIPYPLKKLFCKEVSVFIM